MSKNLKTLLVAFSTVRKSEETGEDVRTRFKAGSVVDLTDAELADLTTLQNSTGKLHFRDPKTEGGTVVASQGEVVETKKYPGEDVSIADKTREQLKAYLTFYTVDFKGNASEADLRKLAQQAEAGQTGNKAPGADDNGL